MIKINRPSTVLRKLENKHIERYRESIVQKLTEVSIKHPRHANFLRFLVREITTLLIGMPSELHEIAAKVKRKYPRSQGRISNKEDELHKELVGIFNYKSFRGSTAKKWSGYLFVKGLGVNVCPYCNRQYINVFRSSAGRGQITPTLDHFYNQTKYPYLALSFYNLVPSCSVCNTNLKGDVEFSIESHMNPYVDEFGDDVKFTLKVPVNAGGTPGNQYDLIKILEPNCDLKIDIKTNPQSPDVVSRARGNVDAFKLPEIYTISHSDYVRDLIQRAVVYDDRAIELLENEFGGRLFHHRQEVLKFVSGNYISLEDLDKRPLAKLTKDIAEELGLLKL